MNHVLVIVACLFVSAFGFKLSQRKAPSYHINNVIRKYTSKARNDLENAMNDSMILSFETNNYSFSLDLQLNTKIYGKHTEIYALDDNGESQIQARRYRAYLGSGTITSSTQNTEIGDCSVNFYKDLRFHCVCVTETDVYSIDLIELHEHDADKTGPILGSNGGHGMVLVIQSEVSESYRDDDDTVETPAQSHRRRLFSNFFSEKTKTQHHHTSSSSSRSLLDSDQSQLVPFTECFDGQYQYIHQLYMGIITDTAYNALYSNDNDQIQTSIESLFNDAAGANMIYYYQLNVQLTLGTFFIGASYSGKFTYDPANIYSGYDINTRLDQLTTWREEYYNQNNDENNGLWHLLTNNHPSPGTVGLAWVGVLCSYGSGAGVSNYINPATSFYGTGTWETWAHEVGHNFGAGHAFSKGQGSTGGIMDYGDGKYPVSSGAYQFHPDYNKDEVCEQITASYADSRWYKLMPVANCWHEYDGSTSSGTSYPTPRPTTSSPTTPSPTVDKTQPTTRPTTGSPTTGSPTTSDGTSYVWYWFKTYSECDLSCVSDSDTAYKLKVYYCAALTTSTSGSTTYYSYKQVDDTYCDSGTKPSETVACDDGEVPSCNSVCGDGLVGIDEICDTAATNGQCCSDDCQSWKTDTIDCWMVNPVIDAAFKDDSGNVYLFQGGYYARYSTYYYGWTNNVADDGYPKSIAGSFPISSFTSDITAIAYASDSEVYVFQGMQYTKIDLDSGEYSGYPKTFNEEFIVPSEITDCGSVTGAYIYPGYGTTIVAWCDNVQGFAHQTYTFTSIFSLSSFNSDYANQKLTACYNTPGYTSISIFTTDDSSGSRRRMSSAISSQSIFEGTNATSLDEIEEQSCYDANCAHCSEDNHKICYECYEDYVLYGSVKCLSNNTLLYLDFDINSASTIDHFFVEGGRDTLVEYDYVLSGVTGENSTAVVFDGSTKVDLIPLEYSNSDQYVSSFKISFRFKPYSVNYDKFISIDDDNVNIILMDNSDEVASFNESTEYIALFKVGNNTYRCSYGIGLTINDWNTLELQFSEDVFKVYINGEITQQAYSDWSGINVELQFHNWYIGSDDGDGIVGELDQVSFKVIATSYDDIDSSLNSGASVVINEIDDSRYKTWLIIGIVAIIATAIFGIGFCLVSYLYCKNKKETTTSGEMQYFQMKS